MRVLLLGAQGQLGTELAAARPPHVELQAVDVAELDLTRIADARALVRAVRPNLILNAAAYTSVDRAESEPGLARALNADAPAALAEEAARIGAGIIHYSTDYVYDGAAPGARREDETPAPLGVYGASKLAGDAAVLTSGARAVVLRTSWLYSSHGHNFVNTMLRLGREQERLRVVVDQRGCPTWARDLARISWAVAARGLEPGGLFHCAGAGATTWHGFATRIFELARARGAELRVKIVEPIATADWPTPARRPANSVLDCSALERAHGLRCPAWEDSLAACLDERLARQEASC